MASPEIEALAQALSRLPGLGPRSARRAVLYLLKKRGERTRTAAACARTGERAARYLLHLWQCRYSRPLRYLQLPPKRDERALCVVEDVPDLWALDKSRLFPGRFHVLGGRLSALEGVRPEDLGIGSLVTRVSAGGIDEVVLAMNATLEGQTTAHYIAERLEGLPIRLT